jgi:Tol biopolymer transport system component/DNA-binding winged helix-turn-helix (wHTH) protein
MAAEAGPARQPTIRFGDFELDASCQMLWHLGVPSKLQNQPFRVLELLVQRAPNIVSREEIRRHVWGDAVHIDENQSINFCIRQIRLALGDTSSDPRFIETLPRQGYRFIAPLPGGRANAGSSDGRLNRSSWLRRVTGPSFVAGIAACLILVVLLAVYGPLSRPPMLPGVVRITPVSTYPGDEREPSLSPDGHQVAFSWDGENAGTRHIYVMALGEQHPLRVTSTTADDTYPAWSPDGKHIAFIRRGAGTRADLMIVSAIGGPERKLREIRLSAWISSRTLAWTPDAKWLCFTNEIGAAGHHVLFLLSPDSGAVQRLLPEEDNGIGDFSPAFSPDGRWLAFARFEHPNNSNLLIQRLSPDLRPEGAPIGVKDAGVNPRAPVWTPDGKKIFFLDRTRIMEAEVGGPARAFYVSTSAFNELTMSEPGPRFVASLQNGQHEIWTIPLGAKGLKAEGPAQRIVQSSAGETLPRFSPDGRSLAFSSIRSGSSEIWLADSDGENPRQLTNQSFYIAGYARWSPDGRFLAFHGRLPDDPQLYVVRVADGMIKQITHGKPGFMGPSWSTDGRTLYADTIENGNNRTYIVPVTSGIPRFAFEGSDAVEAPRRKLLIYYKQDQSGIYCRSLAGDAGKSPERLLVADYQAPWGGFYPVDDGIYYVGYSSIGLPRAFRFYSFDTGKSADVAPSPSNLHLGLTVTPDRTRLAYSTKSLGSEDLVQIELQMTPTH